MPNYTKTGVKINGNIVMSPILEYLIQTIINIYEGNQERGTTVSVHIHL